MACYGGEMPGYGSEIVKFPNENAITPMGYGSNPASKPCFFASLGRNIQGLLAQA